MARFQFSLRNMLLGIAAIAVALLLVRFAMQSHGVAVALLVVVLGAFVLTLANIAVYALLRAVGLVFGMDAPPPAEEFTAPNATSGPANSPPN